VSRADLVAAIRAVCDGLPEVTERPSHGAPTWFVRDRTAFVTVWPDGHHRDDFPHLGCAAPPGEQAALIAADPARFFRPPYVGHRGWIGVRLDVLGLDWDELAAMIADAHRLVTERGRSKLSP
jgi:hypothetical protein